MPVIPTPYDFRLIGNQGRERKFVLIDPAMSPVYKQNPGFRVVSYRSDGSVADQSTYHLTNLKSASKTSPGRWRKEYTFTRKWKARELNATSQGDVYSRVVANDRVRDRWLKLYAVSGPAEQGEKPVVRGLYRAVESPDVASYKTCFCPANLEAQPGP